MGNAIYWVVDNAGIALYEKHTIGSLTSDWMLDSQWLQILVPMMVSLCVILMPGMVIGYAARLRCSRLVAWAPIGSVAVIVVAALLAPILRLDWGIFPVALVTFLFAAGGWIIGWVTHPKADDNDSLNAAPSLRQFTDRSELVHALTVVGSILIVAATWTVHFARLINVPYALPQNWDNAFHINQVQRIIESGDGSSLHMSLALGGRDFFYPGAWHDSVSLVVMISGSDNAVAVNAFATVILFFVWPLGLYGLSRSITRDKRVALLAIPASQVFPQFPLNFVSYGTLYPNMLAVCLIPGALMLVIDGIRRWDKSTIVMVYLSALSSVALSLSQPNALFSYLLTVIAIAWGFHIRRVVQNVEAIGRRVWGLLGVTALWLGAIAALSFVLDIPAALHSMRHSEDTWQVQGNLKQGLVQLLSASGGRPQIDTAMISAREMLMLGILAAIGLVWLILTKRQYWIIGAYGILSALFLVGYSIPGKWRTFIVGLWYTEVPRLWAPLTILLVLGLAAGAVALLRGIQRLVPQVDKKSISVIFTVTISLFYLVYPLCGRYSQTVYQIMSDRYDISDTSPMDSDEYQLFRWMNQNLPDDAVVIANPWEGGVFAWGVGGTRAVFPTLNVGSLDKDLSYLGENLRDAGDDPAVCQLLDEYHVSYALDLADRYFYGGESYRVEEIFEGLDGAAESGIGHIVKQYGEAKLVEITVCD